MFGDFWSADRVRCAPPATRARLRAILLVACLVLLSGCRLDVAAEAVVDAADGGTVAFVAGFDPELLDRLDALGIDPTAELEAAAATNPDWATARRLRDDGGLEVVATRDVDAVAEIGDAFRELSAGLAETDPALLIDVEVTRDDDGGTEVLGTAALRPPATAGASLDGVEIGPDTQELAALVAETVEAHLRIRFPGDVLAHDADRLEGRTVTWILPPGGETPISARAAPPSWWTLVATWWTEQPGAVVVAGLALVMLLAGAGALLRRSVVTREE